MSIAVGRSYETPEGTLKLTLHSTTLLRFDAGEHVMYLGLETVKENGLVPSITKSLNQMIEQDVPSLVNAFTHVLSAVKYALKISALPN